MSSPKPPVEVILKQAEATRAKGGRVVLANGAFDLLHVGHLRYLRAAAELADFLVVAINSDLSVARAKGPDRPIVPEYERCELVAALRGVDAVWLFDDDTVVPIIRQLRPHLHAKGTDYTRELVPERHEVEACGGEVVIVGDAKNHATSLLVARLRANAPGAVAKEQI